MAKYEWRHNESDQQEYFEAFVGKDYLLVWRNKFEKTPNTWMGCIDQGGSIRTIHDKTANDRQRKRQGLDKGESLYSLTRWALLTNTDPEYMMKKVERCYSTGKTEICR